MPTAQTQHYSIEEFADLLKLETQLGILDGMGLMQLMARFGGLPKEIRDVRGALRLALARVGDGFDVTTYSTDLSRENLLKDLAVKHF